MGKKINMNYSFRDISQQELEDLYDRLASKYAMKVEKLRRTNRGKELDLDM